MTEDKSIFDNLESITIYKDGSKFGYESWFKPETIIIAGNWKRGVSPIAYIHKPKSVSIEDWNRFKEKLRITLLK
jgi:hypothetical protein